MDSGNSGVKVKSLKQLFESKQNDSNSGGKKKPKGPNVLSQASKDPQSSVKHQQSGTRNDSPIPVSGRDQVTAQVKKTDPPVDGPEKGSATIGEGGHSGETQEEQLAGVFGRNQVKEPENGDQVDETIHNAQDSATGVKDSQSKTTGKIVDPPSNDCNNDSATPVIGNMSETTEGISTGEQKSRDTSGKETRVENAATGFTSPGEDQVKETDDQGKSSHPIEEDSEAMSVERLKRNCLNIGQISGVHFLKLPLKRDTYGRIERYSLGDPSNKQRRTILMMGATGSGKTTLINGMINYILGVEWNDPFRFKLIDEKLKASQAHSQTEIVTAYDIHWMPGMRIDCSLTIVDTPGYGDTKGIEQDKEITASIGNFFKDPNGIQEVDVVGIVATASQGRLTSTQVYIFESLLSIFGQDIRDNISLLVTFDDGQGKPAVMSAVQEAKVPCLKDANGQPVIHRFNNSGLMPLSREQGDYKVNSFTKSFWDIGLENFQEFFIKLGEMETRSLTLTRDVLEERKHLQTTVQELPSQIQMKLINLEKLKQTKQSFEENQAQINDCYQPQFAVHEVEGQKIDLSQKGQFATNCLNCQKTCHYPCSRRNGENLRRCSAMHWLTKNCKVCDNCSWGKHENQPYRWVYDVKTKFVLAGDVLREYEALQRKKLTEQELIRILQEDINSAKSKIMNSVETAVASTRRLREIALRPSSVYSTDYIEMLITNEERDKKTGYEGRISNLQQLRDEAKILVDIHDGRPITNLNIQ